MWEFSSAGRASALQAEGHRFEPYCSHHFSPLIVCGNGSVVERRLAKANVASSNLVSRSIFLLWGFSHKVMLTAPSPSGKARVCKTLTPSSNLGGASKTYEVANYHLVFIYLKRRRCGGIGRRKGLKIPRSNIRAGSSPASGTTKIVRFYLAIFFLPLVFY